VSIKRKRVGFRPYGERFGGREDERGSDAEEGPATGERDVDDAGPPVHGRSGGEVAGGGARRPVVGGKDLVFFLELGKDLVAHASTVFLECALLWAFDIHGPHSLGKFCPVSDHFGLCATGLDTVKPICHIVPYREFLLLFFKNIWSAEKFAKLYI
jgi:hypothetical protein